MDSLAFSRRVVLLYLALVQLAHSQTEFVPISELSFADDNLAACVTETAQLHGWTTVARLGSLNCSARGISSADGIDQLVALSSINLSANALTDIDVSSNTHLRYLYLQENNFATIDLSESSKLWVLDLHSNQLTDVNLSANTELLFLYLNDNLIESIDVSSNSSLVSLNLQDNDISQIDLSDNIDLSELKLFGNTLTSIEVTDNTSLQVLDLHDNQLQELDVSFNPELKQLYVQGNELSALDIENNTLLLALDVSDNQLSEINVSQNPNIKVLNLAYNTLDEISLVENVALTNVYLRRNNIAQLDVSNNDAIVLLDVRENPLDTDSNDSLSALSDNLDLMSGYPTEIDRDALTITLSAVKIGEAYYRVVLSLVDGVTLQFEVSDGLEITDPNTDDIAVFDGSLLTVPEVEFDSARYSILLRLAPSDDTYLFDVISIVTL